MPKSKTSLNDLLYDIRRIAEHREKLTDEKIRAIYQTLEKDLKAFIAENYEKYADDEGRLYTAYLDSKNQRAKFMQEIVDNFDGISPLIKAQMVNLIDETYEKSYKGMLTAFKEAEAKGRFEEATKDIAVNPNVLKSAINNNISKLTLPQVLERHRAEIIYQVQQELNIGLMQGDRYERMAKRISERCSVSYNKAMNITRTETHRNIESGYMDAGTNIQDKLEGSGLVYVKIYRTAKDERVRPQQRRKNKKGKWITTLSKNGANHQNMEGQVKKVTEPFVYSDGVKTMNPGSSGYARHDCNCRCFTEFRLLTQDEYDKIMKNGGKI